MSLDSGGVHMSKQETDDDKASESSDEDSDGSDDDSEKSDEDSESPSEDPSETNDENSKSESDSDAPTEDEESTDSSSKSEESDETTTLDEESSEDMIEGPVEITVETSSYGGRYQPRNIGALWITTADGEYLRTLAVWALIRQRYLITWSGDSGGDKSDAMTAATLKTHTSHAVMWDRSDVSGNIWEEGDYILHAEVTEDDGFGRETSLPFTIGEGAKSFDAGPIYGFASLHVQTPG